MKKNIFYLFFLVSTVVKAQSYTPIVSSLNEWHLTSCNNGCITDKYYINGDTTFNGLDYKVLDGFHYIERTFWLREVVQEKKVYLSYQSTNKQRLEKLLYDFSLTEGDTMLLFNPISPFLEDGGYYLLDSIVPRILNDGNFYKHFYFSPTASNNISFEKPVWIEGLGSLSLINAPGGGPNVNGAGKVSCYYKDDNLVYTQSDSIVGCEPVFYLSAGELSKTKINFVVYPNPSKDYLYFKGIDKAVQISIFGLDGCLLKTENNLDKINITDLTKGYYWLEVALINGQTQRLKIIKL